MTTYSPYPICTVITLFLPLALERYLHHDHRVSVCYGVVLSDVATLPHGILLCGSSAGVLRTRCLWSHPDVSLGVSERWIQQRNSTGKEIIEPTCELQ